MTTFERGFPDNPPPPSGAHDPGTAQASPREGYSRFLDGGLIWWAMIVGSTGLWYGILHGAGIC